MAERIKMKINSKDFRVRPGEEVKLREWPTIVKPFCRSKKRYHKLLEEHVEELSSLQRLHYASDRYALLLIFQGMDAAGKDGATLRSLLGVTVEQRSSKFGKRWIEIRDYLPATVAGREPGRG